MEFVNNKSKPGREPPLNKCIFDGGWHGKRMNGAFSSCACDMMLVGVSLTYILLEHHKLPSPILDTSCTPCLLIFTLKRARLYTYHSVSTMPASRKYDVSVLWVLPEMSASRYVYIHCRYGY